MLADFRKNFEDNRELYLRIKARPNAAKTEIQAIMEDETVKINIAAKPEKNKANVALIKFLAKEFNVEKSNINIISGAGERVKLVKITK